MKIAGNLFEYLFHNKENRELLSQGCKPHVSRTCNCV